MSQWAAFPAFPLDLSADFLADLEAPDRSPRGETPVLVSHDIDSAEGLRNLVHDFLPLEEEVGARSSNYIVPCAWPVDDELVRDAFGRGHEIGVHGTDHSNRTPFLPPAERRARLDRGRAFGDRFGAIGYRAPSLLRTRALLDDLASRYRYDSSIPTSGGLFPVPNNGCASARPYSIGRLMEIPVSMPRDGSLRFLGYPAHEIVRIWIDCAERIAAAGGVVVLLTHCEARFSGNEAMRAAYREFLHHVAASSRFRFALPADILTAQPTAHAH
jgi:peptidoglycan/xylan/chitin deacetylase (PgdA/CDA1 family)